MSDVDVALLNVERAARELDAMFSGEPGAWTLDTVEVYGQAASALLSLHDYLNDVTNARSARVAQAPDAERLCHITGVLALAGAGPPECAAAAIAAYADRVITETTGMWPPAARATACHEGLRLIAAELRRGSAAGTTEEEIPCPR